MTYRTSRKLGNVLMGAAAVSLVAGISWDRVILSVLALALLLVDYIQTRAFYRCPHCGGRFDMREDPPHDCPACGKELD